MKIGASNSVRIDDSVPIEVKVAGEAPPPEIDWLLIALILSGVIAGTSIAYALTTA